MVGLCLGKGALSGSGPPYLDPLGNSCVFVGSLKKAPSSEVALTSFGKTYERPA